jgi:hypothetical protein
MEVRKMNWTKKILVILGVLVVFAGQTPAGSVWINNVDIIPIQPSDIDSITFNITGGAATATSHIEYDQFLQNGTSLQLDLYVKAGMVTVPSNWAYSRQLQPLPPATYTLELRAFDYWTGTFQDTYATEFVVTPEPTTLAILGFALPLFRIFVKRKR